VPGTPEPNRERALARACVGLDVAQVVHDQERGAERADADAREQRVRRPRESLHPVRAADGDEAEEDEDEDVAEPVVGERERSAV
jgi:hypothetical protein